MGGKNEAHVMEPSMLQERAQGQPDIVNMQFPELKEDALAGGSQNLDNIPGHQDGISALQERYGGDISKCPYLNSLGQAGIELYKTMVEAEQSVKTGPTLRELMAARRDAQANKEPKQPEVTSPKEASQPAISARKDRQSDNEPPKTTLPAGMRLPQLEQHIAERQQTEPPSRDIEQLSRTTPTEPIAVSIETMVPVPDLAESKTILYQTEPATADQAEKTEPALTMKPAVEPVIVEERPFITYETEDILSAAFRTMPEDVQAEPMLTLQSQDQSAGMHRAAERDDLADRSVNGEETFMAAETAGDTSLPLAANELTPNKTVIPQNELVASLAERVVKIDITATNTAAELPANPALRLRTELFPNDETERAHEILNAIAEHTVSFQEIESAIAEKQQARMSIEELCYELVEILGIDIENEQAMEQMYAVIAVYIARKSGQAGHKQNFSAPSQRKLPEVRRSYRTGSTASVSWHRNIWKYIGRHVLHGSMQPIASPS